MNFKKLIMKNNRCYIANVPIIPRGVMVHSTGANNPYLKRYVGPDDGLLGFNQYDNHWNNGNVDVGVHAFIGKLADGSIAAYQTLPWNIRAWHCGRSGNDTHISFEICEDGLIDAAYFGKVYREAVELTAYLCGLYNLDPLKSGVVICHSEGNALGIASAHGDVMHWFPKHGKTMDMFRADIKSIMEDENMTQDKFNGFFDSVNPMYRTINDVPETLRKEAQELINAGAIRGTGKKTADGKYDIIDIRYETLRAAIINKRYIDAQIKIK